MVLASGRWLLGVDTAAGVHGGPIGQRRERPVVIGGSVAEGFEPVRAAFESNLRDRDELGASVALYRGAEPLVDLWGGHRDEVAVLKLIPARSKP